MRTRCESGSVRRPCGGRVDGIEEGTRRRGDRERRLVDAAELVGAGMDVDQRLPGLRHVEQRVAGSHRFAEPLAEDEQHVGIAHTGNQQRVAANADVACIVLMAMIEEILVAKRAWPNASPAWLNRDTV